MKIMGHASIGSTRARWNELVRALKGTESRDGVAKRKRTTDGEEAKPAKRGRKGKKQGEEQTEEQNEETDYKKVKLEQAYEG